MECSKNIGAVRTVYFVNIEKHKELTAMDRLKEAVRNIMGSQVIISEDARGLADYICDLADELRETVEGVQLMSAYCAGRDSVRQRVPPVKIGQAALVRLESPEEWYKNKHGRDGKTDGSEDTV